MYGGMAILNIQRAITLKAEKQELLFMCSACHLMVFNICVKFYENMSRGFQVMEQTQKLLTHTHTHTHTNTHTHTHTHTHTQRQRKDNNYIPHCIAYFVCRGYNQSYGS